MENQESNGLLGLLLRPITVAAHVTSLLWQKATQDGHLGRAGLMGLDEIGQALKAFPDSIHGTAREAAADNGYCGPSPSEIAAGHSGIREQGSVHGRDQDDGPPRSPSEIAADHGGDHGSKSDQGHEAGQETWRERIERERAGNQDGNNGNDQNERGRGRSLPDEQREQKQQEEQERSRGR